MNGDARKFLEDLGYEVLETMDRLEWGGEEYFSVSLIKGITGRIFRSRKSFADAYLSAHRAVVDQILDDPRLLTR